MNNLYSENKNPAARTLAETRLVSNERRKTTIANVLLLVVLIATYCLAINIIFLIVDDIRAGALRHASETGLGLIIAGILSPIELCLILVSRSMIRTIRKRKYQVSKIVIFSLLITFCIVAIYRSTY